MQITSQQVLPVSQQQAWDALNDTALLQAAIPGCESITPDGQDEYALALTAAIGPVKARFKGRLKLADQQPPESYTLQFEGQGGAAGFGKGTAAVRLEPRGPRETVLHYNADAQVGGRIAQVGSRLVDMAAQKMASDFFDAFNAALQQRYAVAPPNAGSVEPSGDAGWWTRLMRWWRSLWAR
jgi:carbon monoxide dehydrogenase subunit G